MGTIQTNRDLYVAIAQAIWKHDLCTRTLEEYLRALWESAQGYRERPSLTPDEFVGLLSGAFTLPVPAFQEAWRSWYNEDLTDRPGFDGWEARVLRQVVDLHEMAERGMLTDNKRYFGIDSPRGQRWYNFDPRSFLECAAEGYSGGWRPGDETDRVYVPGPVAVLGKDGQLRECDPRDLPRPLIPVREVSWDDFRSFLEYGQWYE
jgi:hypothetical protein